MSDSPASAAGPGTDPDPPDGGTEIVSARARTVDGQCPSCGATRAARATFCESCGRATIDDNSDAALVIEVIADRDLFESLDTEGLDFPAGRPPLSFAFGGDDVVNIGRRRDPHGPRVDVDLSGALADPAASQRHAQLVRTGDARYELIDVGSTNGTTVNDSPHPIAAHTPVPVTVGDRIHVGAWTTIVIRRIN